MLRIVWNDILDVIVYIPDGLMLGVLWAMGYYVYTRYHGSNWRFKRVVIQLFFICYLVVVIKTALLCREPGSRDGMDLRLFSTWGNTYQAHAYVIENIIMFVPFGFFLPVVFKPVNFLISIFMGFFVSLSIETIQLFTRRGFFQVDDIVTNMLGTIIGYLIYRFCTGMLTKKCKE